MSSASPSVRPSEQVKENTTASALPNRSSAPDRPAPQARHAGTPRRAPAEDPTAHDETPARQHTPAGPAPSPRPGASGRPGGSGRLDDGQAELLLAEMNRLPEDDPRRERLRARIVDLHASLVRGVARRYANRGEPMDDLLQVAYLGLVKAINRFDPDVGDRFVTYAYPVVTGEVKRHFRDKTWGLRVSRRIQELRPVLQRTVQEFTRENGRSPTTGEIAGLMEITEEETVEVLVACDAYRPLSLEAPADGGQSGDTGGTVGEYLGSEDPALDAFIDGHALGPLIDGLPERERTILLLRFFGNKTQTQIAEHVGLSQMHVSRLLRGSLEKLRAGLLTEG
ncbi:SigB/SigF/SigG family RNA polymerase sigma factor [Actinomadura sp. WMMB 499]|uniref:SigB/SigF/SigG family RNA polymerase sigma factor n=1 Tax=Actinomadura sp. WMMB 499 TaxID=1219491 RepID=UPI00124860F2|nr:SigB/SigF/SigG family RNA polymerase sigma factor [Actinomadura sp. WMMB 499]QFG26626.1 SigB/SigF/SigG family RNA polymerase sigma factor [Actinomadura sp. WMMB 499]